MNIRKPRNNCKQCGKECSEVGAIYCSNRCQASYQSSELKQSWLNGDINPKQTGGFIRRYLMELHDCKCEQCGWSQPNPVTGNVPLEVHHIDGDSTNNNINNLKLLCPNCHSLTVNYKKLNEGNGRKGRK